MPGHAFKEGALRLNSSLPVRMIAETAGMECIANPATRSIIMILKCLHDIFRCAYDQNLAAGLKTVIDPWPVVAQHASAGSAYLEDTRRR